MAESILDAIRANSAAQREALSAQAQADITARNAVFAASKVAITAPPEPVVAALVANPGASATDAGAAIAGAAAAPAGDAAAAAAVAAPTTSVAAATAGETKAGLKAGPVLKATSLVDEEHGVIMLVGSLADAVDLDLDSVPSNLLIKCAHEFTGRDQRTFNANHDEAVKASLVESMTGVPILASGRRLKAGEHIPDNDPMVSIGLAKAAGEATAWVLGVKPDDPAVVQAAKDGKLVGGSWGGFATRSKA